MTFTYPLCLQQYATYEQSFVWTTNGCCPCGTVGASAEPVDLTGYTAQMQIRPFANSTTLYYDASDNVTLYGISGQFLVDIPASVTSTFTWFSGVYDLLMTDPYGNVTRLLAGPVMVTLGVTT